MATPKIQPLPLSDARFRFDDWYPAFGPDASTDHAPPGHMTFAEAVHRVCDRLLISYHRDFPLLATLPSVPVVPTELAFLDGSAIDVVHDRYAPTIRAVEALCTLAGGSPLSQNDNVWRTIGSDRFASPHPFRDFDGFAAVFGTGEPVSRGDWDYTHDELGGWRSFSMMARRVLTAAAGVLVPLAATGRISTSRTAILGPVDLQPVEQHHWNTTIGVERLADRPRRRRQSSSNSAVVGSIARA